MGKVRKGRRRESIEPAASGARAPSLQGIARRAGGVHGQAGDPGKADERGREIHERTK